MNSTNKQHRHPGLWTLPLDSEQAAEHNFSPLTVATRYPDLSQSAQSQLDERLITAFTACANDNQLAGRWVTIIGQPETISAKQLGNLIKKSGLPAHRVRWLRPGDADSKAWAAEQALLLDNSALIVAWLGQCQARDAQRLHLARRHTQANTLLFCQASEKTPLH